MSTVSFLRGSRYRYDESRYALVVCLCAALVFIFLAAFSAPMTDAIYLVQITVQSDDFDVVVVLGTLGYCWKTSGVEACSKVVAGYQLGREVADPIPAALPLIPTWSTTVLSLQVVTFGVTFIVCAIIISAHFVPTYFARWPLVYCGIAAVLQLTCYVFDDVLFSVTRSAMDQSSTVKLGNGTWLAMVAFILLCSAIVGDCIQLRRCPTHRPDLEKTHIITPYTVSDVEARRKDNSTIRTEVLDLIPANERRSVDQLTIDVIYRSLVEDATSTTPTTTTESTASQPSHISSVNQDNNPFGQQSARTVQSAPDIVPIANPNPTFPNPAITLPDVVVIRQVPFGPREARAVSATQPPLPPLVPVRRKVTVTRYVPSSYYTYQSRSSDSEQTVSTTTFFPRSSTQGFLSRATTMRSGVLPSMSERHASTPSILTQRSEDYRLPHFSPSMGSTSTLSSAWNSIFQKLAPTNPQTPPLPHFPISSRRFGGDRFVEAEVSDDTWSVASAVQSSDLEHSSDLQYTSSLELDYPILLDASIRPLSQDSRRARRLI
ncbi:hypothetical protein D9619_002649 [Psilocybe cf. subviscida]|uniref:Uncharacterized protein n=1 Tax=Psilocybe cf. subviscida TaxID=2480587 RepID=A0A8H5AY99_9AGAR|nr:hypothetical protein D9619_002649 [Psilocybe cf. subviscida]